MFKEENKYWLNSLYSDTKFLGNTDKILLFESKYKEELRIRIFPYLKSGKFKEVLEALSWRDSDNIIHFFDEDFIFFYLILNENFYLIQKHLNSLFSNCRLTDYEISKKYNFLRFVFFNLKDFNDSFVNLDFKIFKIYCIDELKIITENEISNSLNSDGRINTLENKVIEHLWKLIFEYKFQDAIELLLLYTKSFNALFAIERFEKMFNLKSIILSNKSLSYISNASKDEISNSLDFIFNFCKDLINVGTIFKINIPIINFLNLNFSPGFDIKLREYDELIGKLKSLGRINTSLTIGQLIDFLEAESLNLSQARLMEILLEKVSKGDFLEDLSWKENPNHDIYRLIVRKGYFYNLV